MAVDYKTAITDRSELDLMRFRELDAKRFNDMTPQEQAEWLAGSKAAYNASDLNRVGGFIADLANLLHDIAGISVDVEPKTDWAYSDIPTIAQLDRYISDLKQLRAALEIDTPDIPDSAAKLTLTGANAIEQLCVNLHAALMRMQHSGFYCNEIYSAEF